MPHIRILGAALLAVFALSAVAVSTASAALEFLASKIGLLLGKQTGPLQKFTTVAGTVECTVARAHGFITALLTKLQLATVDYSNCKFIGVEATVSPAHYTFNANGTVTVDNEITVTALGVCTVKVKPQGPLSTVKYLNVAGPPMDIELDAEVGGIAYKLEPGCIGAGNHTDGTYTGRELVFEDSGDLLWDA